MVHHSAQPFLSGAAVNCGASQRHPEDSGLKLNHNAINSDFRDNLGPGNLHNTLQIYKVWLVAFPEKLTIPLPSLVWVIVWVSECVLLTGEHQKSHVHVSCKGINVFSISFF